MKKILLVLSLSIGLIGCSSVNLSAISPSDVQTEKILALGLTHDENLVKAGNLTDLNMASAVIKELNNRLLEAEKSRVELEKISKYAKEVKILDNNSKYIGFQVSDSKIRGLLGEYDLQDYFLQGLKDANRFIEHKLNFSVTYTSDEKRNYESASFCDKWQGCKNEELFSVILISQKASGCNSSSCDYTEVMSLDISDSFLRKNMVEGFSVAFKSKKYTNKITISSSYIKGYLKVAN